MSPLYLHKEQVLFHRARHVALPCYYSSPERTYQTLALERTFRVFPEFCGHLRLPHALGSGRVIKFVAICNITTRRHEILHSGPLSIQMGPLSSFRSGTRNPLPLKQLYSTIINSFISQIYQKKEQSCTRTISDNAEIIISFVKCQV